MLPEIWILGANPSLGVLGERLAIVVTRVETTATIIHEDGVMETLRSDGPELPVRFRFLVLGRDWV